MDAAREREPESGAPPAAGMPAGAPQPSPALAPNFKGMRYSLWASLAAAIIFPLGYVGVSAYNDWHDKVAAATDVAVRSTRVAQEHALKLFDIDAALTSRLVDALGDRDDQSLLRDERTFHMLAKRLGGGYPQVSSISLFSATGALLASSRMSPAPKISVAERGDLEAARRNPLSYQISGPTISLITHMPFFSVSLGRVNRDGRFMGMVSIGMRPAYYQDFYRDLLGDGAPLNIGLLRSDGAVLAWYPPLAHGVDALTDHALLLRELRSSTPSGVIVTRPMVDGVSKILAFRRVGGYDAYVAAEYPMSAVWTAWFQRCLVVGTATLLPSIALWIFLLVSLRRLAAEELAWHRLINEASTRAMLERSQRERQRLETLGNLVATVAHDFNNLLMAISAHAQVGLRDTSSLKKDLRAILRAVGNGQALTRRLLGVARKQPLREELVDLPRWSKGLGLVRATLGDSNAFNVQVEEETWPVHVDSAELELAILNVAINARDAMPNGGSFDLSMSNVQLPAGRIPNLSGDYVCISMTDNGEGMDPEVKSRAFEPFFSTKPVGRGTGIGLAQGRAFCERSGGAATLSSALGVGTTVTFYLPRARGAAGQTGQAGDTAHSDFDMSGACRLLLVEDDVAVAEAEKALLEMLGHEVAWAQDAQVALQMLENTLFDAVLSDVEMPGGMSGIDLAERLRRERPDLPVTLLTGYAEDLERISTLGLTVFSKPFDVTELHDHILANARAAGTARNG